MKLRLPLRMVFQAALVMAGLVAIPVLALAAPIRSPGISYAYYDPLSLILKDKS